MSEEQYRQLGTRNYKRNNRLVADIQVEENLRRNPWRVDKWDILQYNNYIIGYIIRHILKLVFECVIFKFCVNNIEFTQQSMAV